MLLESQKEILRRETENSEVTEFEDVDGNPYPYVILPLESRASLGFFDALIIEDMISSGGTLVAAIKALKVYEIAGIGSVYERGDGMERIKKETGQKAKGLMRLEIKNGRPLAPRFWGD